MNNFQLPKYLKLLNSDNFSNVIDATELLFITGDDEFVTSVSEKLGFPSWMDSDVFSIGMTLDHITLIEEGKERDYPIVVTLTFYRRPQDDMIVCLATPSSLVVHWGIVEPKLLEMFPKILKDKSSLFINNTSQFSFEQWCAEKVTSRRAKIKTILNE